ncbi:acetyltransferase [Thalassotalea fonticola]|uniref:Acetyltransferase n=1 Tax=Thalassotalea fonticola TaxID=3065649 RepID=A0ABZ0GSR1_9GAMM|nr:acetyltransferase [Colwelliaceae bacterium S1-1]
MPLQPKTLAILGIEDHGKVAAEIAQQNGYEVYFFDDKFPSITKNGHWDVVGNEQDLIDHGQSYDEIFIALSHNKLRKVKLTQFKNLNFTIATLISKDAIVSDFTEIGLGAMIVANACINYGTAIGEGTIINTGSNIDHGCTIGSYVHISPGVNMAAEISVGEYSWIGIGSNLIHQINIGHTVIAGAGAVILNDVPAEVTVVGCPAHIVRRR